MPRISVYVVVAVCLVGAGVVRGQVTGDTIETVRARLGPPQLSRRSGEKEIWLYRNSVRVTFERGVVVSVSNPNGAATSSEATSAETPAAGDAARGNPSRGDPGAGSAPVRHDQRSQTSATAPISYRDDARHIRFTLPAGFERKQPSDATLLAAWVHGAPADKDLLAVTLAEIPGQLRKGPLPPGMIPPGRTSFLVPWRGETLNCVRVEEDTADGAVVNLNLVLPIGSKVLRLGFAGRAANESGVRELLDQTLKTLDVTLAYSSLPTDPAERLGMLLGSVVCIAVCAFVVRRMLKRLLNRSPQQPQR